MTSRGSMDTVLPTAQTLARWTDANGYRPNGYPREVNLERPENADDRVTELQAPVTRADQSQPSLTSDHVRAASCRITKAPRETPS